MTKKEKELLSQQIYELLPDDVKRDVSLAIFHKHMTDWFLVRKRYEKVLKDQDFTEMFRSLLWDAVIKEAIGVIAKVMDIKKPFQAPTDLAGKVRFAKWFSRQFSSPQEALQILGATIETIA